ncbi:MAG: prepilin-type N-terminal cleavage/methylation domain-containing protein [Phycisphaeraceae bacterium]
MTTPAAGFTIVELLVAIGIIGIIVAIAVPATRSMLTYSRGEAGVNSVSIAVNAARIYNHRLTQDDLGGVGLPYADEARYSGTAMIVTPAGEIRLAINDQAASRVPHNQLSGDADNDLLENPFLNMLGYEDIEGIDYITVPRSAGIVGVYRNGGDTQFVAPPFAVRINEHGHIATDHNYIYYDGDYNGVYDTGNTHDFSTSYDPAEEDPRSTGGVPQTDGKYHLPYEGIPTVAAVLLFDRGEFQATDHAYHSSDAEDWFTEKDNQDNFVNVTPIYLNPTSGVMLRDR